MFQKLIMKLVRDTSFDLDCCNCNVSEINLEAGTGH